MRLLLPKRQRENWFSPRLSRKKFPFFFGTKKNSDRRTDNLGGGGWMVVGEGWEGGEGGGICIQIDLHTAAGASPRPTLDRRFSEVSHLHTSVYFSTQVSLGSCVKKEIAASKDTGSRGNYSPLQGRGAGCPTTRSPKKKTPRKRLAACCPAKSSPQKGEKPTKKGDRGKILSPER